ncbi:M24 family metallopeptidase [Pyxidicoccus sp. MSG2]|uniref:M24 family metallopeptidase n=1 Tax=Pyxidicoccus sp. MSG2 TaxID=2996790 RepID=UPI0022706F00|nr:Xaa-Pro peptidase family protein [Pyxidicoccus sp. MSG2]MCY1016263.1 Xaa-Pro peptidase family protein [Pyxidicoccus sp. MSG2]
MERVYSAAESAEFQRRHDRLVAELETRSLEQLVLTSTESIFYLTGATAEPLERPFFLVVDVARARRFLVVPRLEQEHLRKGWGPGSQQEVLAYAEFPAPAGQGWKDALLALLRPGFAFEPSTPHERAAVLVASGGHSLELLEPLRMVKSDFEVARIERAAYYAMWGVEQILRSAYQGATVIEGYMTTTSLRRKIIQEEAHFDALATDVLAAPWPAPLSSEPHSVPGATMKLEGGPHVALVLTRVNGYAAECERTFFTTRPTAEQGRLFALMLEARRIAFEKVRPGVLAADVDAAVNDFLTREGFGDPARRLHRTGHGFGLGNHEPPWVAVGSEHRLERNMLISIEPGLYVPGVGGYRHSDTVLVTDGGYRVLTGRVPTDIRSLTFGRPSLQQRVRASVIRRLAGV